MKALIILALLALIYCDDDGIPSINEYTTFVCPDDKIKLKNDVCAYIQSEEVMKCKYDSTYQSSNEDCGYIYGYTNPTSGGSTITVNIKKKCGKNEKCKAISERVDSKDLKYSGTNDEDLTVTKKEEHIFKCINYKVNLLKENKKCSFGGECLTGYCSGGKCKTLDKCTDDENCGKGKYCYTGGTTPTCKSRLSGPGTCDANNSEKCCGEGLSYIYDSTEKKYKCIKYFSLSVGDTCDDSEQCKSGICSSSQCVSYVETDSTTCDVTCKDSADKKFTCLGGSFTNKDEKEVCLYPKEKFDLLGDMIDRYNKIKLDKLNKKEDYAYIPYSQYFGDKKYAEKKAVYDNYAYLKDQGLIKSDGKRNGDKKCEYEFWKSTISSSYVHVYLGFALALLGLLL